MYVAWAPFFSGAERALHILVEHLDRSKYRPVVAVGTQGGLAEGLRSIGVETVHIPIAYTGLRSMASFILPEPRPGFRELDLGLGHPTGRLRSVAVARCVLGP